MFLQSWRIPAVPWRGVHKREINDDMNTRLTEKSAWRLLGGLRTLLYFELAVIDDGLHDVTGSKFIKLD